jgi:hypothetical protein
MVNFSNAQLELTTKTVGYISKWKTLFKLLSINLAIFNFRSAKKY